MSRGWDAHPTRGPGLAEAAGDLLGIGGRDLEEADAALPEVSDGRAMSSVFRAMCCTPGPPWYSTNSWIWDLRLPGEDEGGGCGWSGAGAYRRRGR